MIQGYYRWVDLEVIYLVPSCPYDFDWLTSLTMNLSLILGIIYLVLVFQQNFNHI